MENCCVPLFVSEGHVTPHSLVPHPSVFEGWDSTSPPSWDFVLKASLALAFGDNGELHAEGVQDRIDGFEARVGGWPILIPALFTGTG